MRISDWSSDVCSSDLFERGFVRLRTRYQALLATTLERRRIFVPLFLAAMVASLVLVPLLGRDFFPSVDSGQIALHVRAPVGTRIEETSATFAKVEKRIRGIIPPDQIKSVVDNIGDRKSTRLNSSH